MKEEILSIFCSDNSEHIDLPYLNYYTAFCFDSKDNSSSSYKERHHIFPVCLFPNLKNNKKYIIDLSAKNHFLAHYYLTKAFPNNIKLLFAFNMMRRVLPTIQDEILILSELYSEFRSKLSMNISIMNKGRKMSDENKMLISKRTKGSAIYKYSNGDVKRLSTDHEDVKNGNAVSVNYGKQHTIKTKHLMSQNGIKGKQKYLNQNSNKYEYISPKDTQQFHKLIKDPMLVKLGMQNGKYIFIHNPETLEQQRIPSSAQFPHGFIRGRINFGKKGNPFASKIVRNLITDDTLVLLNDCCPYLHTNLYSKYLYFCTINNEKYFSGSSLRMSEKFNFISSLVIENACKNNNTVISKRSKEPYFRQFIGKRYKDIGFFSVKISKPFNVESYFSDYEWV